MKELEKFLQENFKSQTNEKTIDSFIAFRDFLVEENTKMNLIGNDSDEFIERDLFIDSLVCFLPIKNEIKPHSKILDIGIGAGFPSIPYVLINDSVDLTGLDSSNKRIDFLATFAHENTLGNISLIHGRAEDFIYARPKHRDRYDFVVARSVASLRILIEIAMPYVKVGGKLVLAKSKKLSEEIEEAKWILSEFNNPSYKIYNYSTVSEKEHNIIVFEKTEDTYDTDYPRRWSEIK